MRSRQVAAASGSDLCSQVAALDWRRPTQCLWTLCIKRLRDERPDSDRRYSPIELCALQPSTDQIGSLEALGALVTVSHLSVHDR